MERPYKLLAAVISAALAVFAVTTGCGVQKGVDAADTSGTYLHSSEYSSLNGNVKKENIPENKKTVPSPSVTVSSNIMETKETDPSYLDNAVFIGDSVTLKLQKYVTAMRKKNKLFFGKAHFLAAGSMGSGNALKPLGESSIHPYYNGKKALIEDSAVQMHACKAYIMLGMNDIAVYGINGSAENIKKLSERIIKKNPGIRIYIQSVTPMLKNKQKHTLNNANIEAYDNKLKEICKQQNWYYIDVASVMRASDGSLKPEYCSDPDDLGIHFTNKACSVWVRYILTHIPAEELQ